ncbi:MAG: glutamate 5-kinase [Eubacterium sp.]|nr:glutamate 5-kinase [Eubacterium sp.]
MNINVRETLHYKNRIVIKVGSSSLVHEETGELDLVKVERMIRIISDLKNQGKDVVLVSSGAISVGRKILGLQKRPEILSMIQACAALGQGELMMLYQKLFMEYNHKAAQVLLTFDVITSDERRKNAQNTLKQLLDLDIIPIVNENDTVATEEIEFGDNDTLSAIVSTLIGADMLVLLTDIDGFYTDDPRKNASAKRISVINKIDDSLKEMAKGTVTRYGTGGMYTKIAAAQIACHAGADVAILESKDMEIIHRLLDGEDVGTIFTSDTSTEFDIIDFIKNKKYLEK